MIELLSPIPPMRTGTATYLDTVLRRLMTAGGSLGRIVIATDPALMPQGQTLPDTLHGMPVVNYETLARTPALGATRIYFLANNDHHAFIHEMLRRSDGRAQGRQIAVIHDPSMFMVHRHMNTMSRHRIGLDELIESCSAQFGDASERLVKARLRGDLPEIFEHGAHCLGPSLERVHEVWAHSLYAANRIVFETNIPLGRLPKIRVCSHPHGDLSAPAPASSDTGRFRIGMFGWVTPPKRPHSILRGLDLALSRMTRSDQERVELLVVGRIPPGAPYDPVADAARLGVSSHIKFIDYPEKDHFEALIHSCDLIFNLRYPSCGESSGTLATAQTSRARYVVSRYQAFREAQGAWRSINVAQPFETWEIAQAILDAMQSPPSLSARTPGTGIASIEKLLLAETLMKADA